MKLTAKQIIDAVVDAAFFELKKYGLPQEPGVLGPLFLDAVQKRSEVLSVLVITPKGDIGESKAPIVAAIEKKFGRVVEIVQKADSTMIGGAVIQIGDERIDLSVRGALTDLQKALNTH